MTTSGEHRGVLGESLWEVLTELDQRADGIGLADRRDEVTALAHEQYGEVTLAARLQGALNAEIGLVFVDGWKLAGELVRCGQAWCRLNSELGPTQWVVSLSHVVRIEQLPPDAVAPQAQSRLTQLSLRTALLPLVKAGIEVTVRLSDSTMAPARLHRVGADFVELKWSGSEQKLVSPLSHVAAVGVGGR